MILTDNDLVTIELPDSLEWVDQYNYSKVRQDLQYTIGGNVVISENSVDVGRPITLVSGGNVWVTKLIFDQLKNTSDIVDVSYTLTVADGTSYNVMFDRTKGPCVEGKPILRQNVPDNTSYFTLTLRFLEV